MSLQASRKADTEGLHADGGQPHVANSSSFSFPWTPMSCVQAQNNMFTTTFQSNFISATNSEANYNFSQVQTSNNYAAAQDVRNATLATNSPMLDISFGLGPGEFDPNFPFDGSNFF